MPAINLDANATYGILPEVREELARFSDYGLNPSSIHSSGQRARALIEESRTEIALLIGSSAHDQIIFTSGATEANNMVFSAQLFNAATERGNIVSSEIEHPSVLEPAKRLNTLGFDLRLISATNLVPTLVEGALAGVCDEKTCLVSLMHANNETGEIFDIQRWAHQIRGLSAQSFIHTDAVQSLGKIRFSFSELGVNAVTLSGHKLGALPGIGALVVKDGSSLAPLMVGGAQEQRMRAGTENVLGILSFGIAAKILRRRFDAHVERMRTKTAELKRELQAAVDQISFHCERSQLLPNTLSIWVQDVEANDLVVALDIEGAQISAGAACASGKPESSHVILAMFGEQAARETIRISIRSESSGEELRRFVMLFKKCVERMRSCKSASIKSDEFNEYRI